MATLILTSLAGSFAGSLGLSAFATAALTAGAGLVGNFIDQALFVKPTNVTQEGPRLDEVRFQGSNEGATIHRVAGRVRVAGNIIWTTRFREEIITETTTQGGGKGGGPEVNTTSTTYNYYVSFAVALCEGPVQRVGRIWADGDIMDESGYTIRRYKGTEAQNVDPKIVSTEGADATSAYKGICYVVFEELLLEDFGNRIPQLNFEVYRSTADSMAEYEDRIKGITIIPSSGEFAYGTTEVLVKDETTDESSSQNNNSNTGETDWVIAIDQLEDFCPNVQNASLVIAWHGTDLRCNTFQLRPKVETATKNTVPYLWQVSGVTRSTAQVVSMDAEDRPLLGGAPADKTVFEAIQDLNNRGFNVTFYPFILMDIPAGNVLPNPYGGASQPTFPWRGRITLQDPSTQDKTAGARTQVNTFFGTCTPAHFGTWDGNTIPYTGPAEWSFRRMILHYAKLCVAAGGVDTFIIGSEMVGINAIRDNVNAFPGVDNFITLAADVRAIVGPSCKIVYASDWSEWANYRPSDGSNDLYFHLDPLYANANINAIAIDNYMPLADWRDEPGHLDSLTYPTIYDLAYLESNVRGGELQDWYYASQADRDDQVRSPITDGAYGKPWVFKPKDLLNWWTNQHYNRPAGVESGSPTAWVPQSKPIWFTELGCPNIDKGPNQPNVFYDPKSSESFFPYYSQGHRDDFVSRRFNIAQFNYWENNANNPLSGVYGGRMVDVNRIYLWTWDARPFPDYPFRESVWTDGQNWERGHWLNGRAGLPTVRHFIEELAEPHDVSVVATDIHGIITGYTISDLMTVRDIIQPLMQIYNFDAYESNGSIRFKHRGSTHVLELTQDDLVFDDSDEKLAGGFKLTTRQLSDMPSEIRVKFIIDDYHMTVASINARRLVKGNKRVSENSFNIVMPSSQAQQVADVLLVDSHVQRDVAEFKLPPSLLYLDAADIVRLTLNNRVFDFRLENLGYEYARPSTGIRTEAGTYEKVPGPVLKRRSTPGKVTGLSKTLFMDLPIITTEQTEHGHWYASSAVPWPGSISVFRAPSSTYSKDKDITAPSVIGQTTTTFASGPVGIWDNGNILTVRLNSFGTPQSADEIDVLTGANAGALFNAAENEWEVLQWTTATLVAANTYELSGLLRGQLGTEHAMADPLPIDSYFVVLQSTMAQSTIALSQINLAANWRYGPTSQPQSSSSYTQLTFTPRGVGLRPYSPCQLSAAKDVATNDISLSWIRRTRIGGDIWDNSDVPLSESVEEYKVDIYNGAGTVVLRTITSNSQNVIYTAAQQTTDFGSSPLTLIFEVCQVSAVVGRGKTRRHTATFLF